jgi:hypothetical protein
VIRAALAFAAMRPDDCFIFFTNDTLSFSAVDISIQKRVHLPVTSVREQTVSFLLGDTQKELAADQTCVTGSVSRLSGPGVEGGEELGCCSLGVFRTACSKEARFTHVSNFMLSGLISPFFPCPV